MLKLCISGLGRAGKEIAKHLMETMPGVVVAAVCSPQSENAGCDLGEIVGIAKTGISVWSSDQLEQCIRSTKPNVVLDFSIPAAAIDNAEIFVKMSMKIVMATTGFSKIQERKLSAVVTKNNGGMIFAPNITQGINAMMVLAELASRMLSGYDIEIVEMHHKSKKDIPSGTALKIANRLTESRAVDYPPKHAEIPVTSVRAGGLISNHKVMLVGTNDMLEITHQSFSGNAYAEGALYAAEFIYGKTGIYEMNDAFNFEEVLADYLEQVSKRTICEEYS